MQQQIDIKAEGFDNGSNDNNKEEKRLYSNFIYSIRTENTRKIGSVNLR